jgi:hypothetical protein
VKTRFDESTNWLVVERGDITLAINLAANPQHVPLPSGRHQVVMASDIKAGLVGGAIVLPPDSVAIIKRGD